jgi:ORF6N domain
VKEHALAVQVERRIYLIRREKVMLDTDLAELYGVPARILNQAVKRNRDRFPEDFMFRLSTSEAGALRSQIVIIDAAHGASHPVTGKRGKHSKYLPYAFTEQGVAMLSSVLRSKRAVQVNIAIMRAFVRLREMLLSNADLARELNALEKKYDAQFKVVFDAIRELMTPPEPTRRQIGFHSTD